MYCRERQKEHLMLKPEFKNGISKLAEIWIYL